MYDSIVCFLSKFWAILLLGCALMVSRDILVDL